MPVGGGGGRRGTTRVRAWRQWCDAPLPVPEQLRLQHGAGAHSPEIGSGGGEEREGLEMKGGAGDRVGGGGAYEIWSGWR